MEECSLDPWTYRQIVDSRVVKIEDNDQKDIDKVKNEENAEQDPGRRAGEEQGIASSRVIEKKLQRLSECRVLANDLKHGPDDKTQKDWVKCVAGKCQKRHDKHREGCVLECDPKKSLVRKLVSGYMGICGFALATPASFFHGDIHGVWRESEAEIVDHCLCRVECPMNVVKEDD